MANEITVQQALQVSNGSLVDRMPLETDLVTQNTSGPVILSKVESIPTTAGGTVISTTGITTLGWLYLKNLDTTNFVKYGPTSAGAIVDFGTLKPGEQALLRLTAGIVLRIIADTAACRVFYKIFDD